MDEVRDFFGTVIRPGDYIMHPIKYGSSINVNLRRVVDVVDGIVLLTPLWNGGPRGRLQAPWRVVVAPLGWVPKEEGEVTNG
ncbi:hypothetical protein UFOVP1292_32 [uncultured Caudovirales phage]|uniref:Uncharacterized protein n=1 Tax=uncultured Caudovirales phage TaxID=2100421 RepID=A0A6J5PDB6_9CAUD|nr:hypothetical protein UFOVP859_63 [uncultured Caudovirales phage]CAB4168535.1 hypothetical protein UFOVP882_61 [uncultured Caudovirales phage]CAB4196428.1 hypothetical protein UFOVP1292_32 [uncultured Caudovirales phage]CAB4205111.1 hypothetical protein UFOVP1411_23 [uncultured Caudovirales phage]